MSNKGEDEQPNSRESLLSLNDKQFSVLIVIIIIILAFAVRLYSMWGTGITWDEPITINAGNGYIQAILHTSFNNSAWASNYEHPAVGKYVYGIVIWLFNSSRTDYNGYMIARLASVSMGVATCLLVYFIGKQYFNRAIGAVSALTLIFIPVFVAHTQLAALDSPIAFFFTLAMFLFMLALKKNRAIYYVISAFSLALLIGVKLNGLLILPVLGIFYLVWRHNYLANHIPKNTHTVKGKGKKSDHSNNNKMVASIKSYVPPVAFIGFCLITVVSLFVLWPWIWFDTANHLSMTLNHWTYDPEEFLFGTNAQSPLYYYIVYFFVTTPLLLLIPLAIGVYTSIRSKDVFKYAILLWFFVPFIYSFSNFKQGGMRYLIMIYPAMALLIGYGLYEIAGLIGKQKVPDLVKKAALPILCALTVVYMVLCLASVYPYYLDYYNSLAGSYQSIHDDHTFNLGWWGEGIYNAESYVSNNGTKNSTTFVFTLPEDSDYQLYGLQSSFEQVPVSDDSFRNYMVNLLQSDDPASKGYYWDANNQSRKPEYVITNYYVEEYFNVTVNPARFQEVYAATVKGVPIAKVYKVL